jgi:hypothetical protein
LREVLTLIPNHNLSLAVKCSDRQIKYCYQRCRSGRFPGLSGLTGEIAEKAVQVCLNENFKDVMGRVSSDKSNESLKDWPCGAACFGFTIHIGEELLWSTDSHPRELFLDGTHNTNRNGFEAYALMGTFKNQGWPLAYLFVHRCAMVPGQK